MMRAPRTSRRIRGDPQRTNRPHRDFSGPAPEAPAARGAVHLPAQRPAAWPQQRTRAVLPGVLLALTYQLPVGARGPRIGGGDGRSVSSGRIRGNPRQRRGVPVVLLDRGQRRGPGRLGELRIAALVPPGYQDLAPKITRHGADEDKHGRIFTALLRQRGLSTVPVPRETDYTMLLEERGFGVAHEELRDNQPLSERNIITYLAHSRVTEQRAAEQMRTLRRYTTGRPEFAEAIRMISR